MSAAELKVVMSLKDEFSDGIKKASQQMKVSIDSIKDYFVGVTAAVIGVKSAIAGLRGTWDLLNLGAQAMQQEEAFRSLTASYGISANELIKRLKEASAETINTSNIMKQASIAIFQGISPDKLVELMEGARAVARLAGESIEDTFNQITEAISSGQARGILKQRGLLNDLEQAYKDYALSIYGVVKPLSAEEEMTARLNVVSERLLELKQGLNLENKTEFERLQSMKAWFEDIQESLSKITIVALNLVAAVLSVAYTAFDVINAILATIEKNVSEIISTISGWLANMRIPFFSDFFDNISKGAKKFSDNLGEIPSTMAILSTWGQQTEEHLKAMAEAWKSVNGQIDANTGATINNTAGIKDNQKTLIAATQQMNEHVEAYKKFMEDRGKVIEELTDKIKKMILSEKDYQSWALEEELKAFQDMYGGDGELMQLFSEYYLNRKEEIEKGGRDLANQLDKSKQDVTDWAAFNAQVAADTVNAIREGFAGFFKDVFSGQLNSAKDLWEGFLDAMINAYANALAEMATKKLFPSSEGGGGGLLDILGFIGGIFGWGGGSSSSSAWGIGFNPSDYLTAQHGAIVSGPSMVLAGETEPEVIAPVRALLNSRGGGSNTTVIYVNAVDAASFADVVRRNPGAITSVVEGGIRNNSSIRHTIKRFAY